MGLGNGNPNEGNKGSNFNYELKTLQLLEAIAIAIEQGGGPGGLTCTTIANCAIIQGLQQDVTDATAKLADVDSACFSPTIASTTDPINKSFGQYQRVGNIVTCTVYFQITGAVSSDNSITIDVPIQDPASDYSAADGLIMGSLTASNIEFWRNLDFGGGVTNGITFYIRNTGVVDGDFTAQFSYAYDTSLC